MTVFQDLLEGKIVCVFVACVGCVHRLTELRISRVRGKWNRFLKCGLLRPLCVQWHFVSTGYVLTSACLCSGYLVHSWVCLPITPRHLGSIWYFHHSAMPSKFISRPLQYNSWLESKPVGFCHFRSSFLNGPSTIATL